MSASASPYLNATSDELRSALAAHARAIQAIVRVVSRRYGCRADEEAELLSEVFLRLVEDDYGVLRKFRGTSSLRTYLRTVACRVLLDRRVETWGKWRPTAKAKTLGADARQLERLIVRDHLTVQEAIGTLVHSSGGKVSYDTAVQLYATLRLRLRARHVPLDDMASRLGAWPEDHVTNVRDLPRRAKRVTEGLRQGLRDLEPAERQLLRLRYRQGQSVADIARATGLDQKRLYRMFGRALERLRAALESCHVGLGDVRSVTGNGRVEVGEVLADAEPAA